MSTHAGAYSRVEFAAASGGNHTGSRPSVDECEGRPSKQPQEKDRQTDSPSKIEDTCELATASETGASQR